MIEVVVDRGGRIHLEGIEEGLQGSGEFFCFLWRWRLRIAKRRGRFDSLGRPFGRQLRRVVAPRPRDELINDKTDADEYGRSEEGNDSQNDEEPGGAR